MSTLHRVHVSLNTDKFEESVTFYQAFLGRDPIKRKPGYAKFELDDPGLNLTLNRSSSSPAAEGSLSHLGLQVSTTELVHRASERLKSSGLATFDEKDTTCCYAVQDKVWVTDPSGNRWEVFMVKQDSESAGQGPAEVFGAAAAHDEAACCTPDCCT